MEDTNAPRDGRVPRALPVDTGGVTRDARTGFPVISVGRPITQAEVDKALDDQ